MKDERNRIKELGESALCRELIEKQQEQAYNNMIDATARHDVTEQDDDAEVAMYWSMVEDAWDEILKTWDAARLDKWY